MSRIERGLLLATALAGVALAGCPRQPEATPPQRTPLAASGEPRPSSLEAEIQARVQAIVTAQQPRPFPTEKQNPQERSIYVSRDSITSFQVEYSPFLWGKSQSIANGLDSVERHPQRPETAAATIYFDLPGGASVVQPLIST